MNAYMNEIENKLQQSLFIVRNYDWLINAYVLDFYVDSHWNKLPSSWKASFKTLQPETFAELLANDRKCTTTWPLSLLCLKKLLNDLCISREMRISKTRSNGRLESCFRHNRLRNIFIKGVKEKKRHEISRMAEICNQIATKYNTQYIVDFGAGLGHLSRVITYGYNLKVSCLEMQEKLNEQAIEIDQQFEMTALKCIPLNEIKMYNRPVHLNMKLTKDVTPNEFLEILKSSFNIAKNDQFSFGIIGLHPCGDLASIIIRLFLNIKEAAFLNLVGCCYMKLSTEGNPKEIGYPLSKFLKSKPCQLSYEAREIACHAIELFEEKLRLGKYEELKVHSYRAALEKILRTYLPELRHCGLKSIKHASSLSFEEYCLKATKCLQREVRLQDMKSSEIKEDLAKWKHVVIFYTLRLMFAPLIESIILYDRVLYLAENGCDVNIIPIFDPKISPRNHITTAVKR